MEGPVSDLSIGLVFCTTLLLEVKQFAVAVTD